AWWSEILSLLLSMGALVAIIITLVMFNGKEQPAWKYSINLNTLIAILSTFLRVCMLFGVEETISQAKWLWYRRPHSLRHIARFDEAARGPWASLLLLFKLRRLDSILLGCVIIILSVGIGPFTQQALKSIPCNLPLVQSNSSIQIAHVINNTHIRRLGPGDYELDSDTKAAIVAGLANPTG
ncbi:hypothetical protein P153DRAFT_271492, partial [Dothidotthia symphoricarpi CBS 119687]